MTDVMTDPTTAAPDTGQRRLTGAVLVAGPVIYLLAEFIAAAAWTDPPYSYTYDFISNLGVRGPTEAFGQVMNSPLAWVMNTGFFLFGVISWVGVLLVRGLPSRRRRAVRLAGTFLAVGGVVLSQFPGSGETAENGGTDFHGLGAMAAFVGGNVLVILLGRRPQLLGLSRRLGTLLVAAGVVGLTFMVAYFVDVSSVNVLIGLVERGVVYPFLAGLIAVGAAIWRAPQNVTR